MDQQGVEHARPQPARPILKQKEDVSLLQLLAVELAVELDHLDKPAPLQLEEQTVPLAQPRLHVLANICHL